jgi:hypothetical protein
MVGCPSRWADRPRGVLDGVLPGVLRGVHRRTASKADLPHGAAGSGVHDLPRSPRLPKADH